MEKYYKGKKLYALSPSQFCLYLSQKWAADGEYAKEENVIGDTIWLEDSEHDVIEQAAAIEKAYNYVVKYNDSLRIRFLIRPFRKTYQYFADYTYESIERLGFRTEQELKDFVDNLIGYPPSLGDNDLVWKKIAVLNNGQVCLVIRIHHVTIDGYSMNTFIETLRYAYECYVSGTEPAPPKKIYSYVNYLEFCEKYKKSEQKKKDLKYFFRMFNKSRKYKILVKGAKSTACDSVDTSLDAEKLDTLSSKTGCSDQVILMACAAMLSYSMAKEEHFCIYFNLHGRRTAAEKHMLGPTMNAVPVFYDFSNDMDITEYLSRCKNDYYEVLSHSRLEYLGFVLCGYFASLRNGFNFVHSWFSFDEFLVDDYKSEKRFKVIRHKVHSTTGPILLYFDKMREELKFTLIYQTELFSREKIEGFFSQGFKLMDMVCDAVLSGEKVTVKQLIERI